MKNYWLDRKNKNFSVKVHHEKRTCESLWERLEICSTSCMLIMKDDNLDKVPGWETIKVEPTSSWQNDGWGE